jgi:hypothetical protein
MPRFNTQPDPFYRRPLLPPFSVMLTVGNALTLTAAVACPPLAEAVTVVVPPPTAFTGIATLVCPEEKDTLAGTVAAAVLLLDTASVPEAVGAGDRVAVSVPLPPALSASGLGPSAVGFGITRANTVMVILVPFFPATCTTNRKQWYVPIYLYLSSRKGAV